MLLNEARLRRRASNSGARNKPTTVREQGFLSAPVMSAPTGRHPRSGSRLHGSTDIRPKRATNSAWRLVSVLANSDASWVRIVVRLSLLRSAISKGASPLAKRNAKCVSAPVSPNILRRVSGFGPVRGWRSRSAIRIDPSGVTTPSSLMMIGRSPALRMTIHESDPAAK